MKLTYDEISPITGNMSVLLESDDQNGWTKICMESGYTTQMGWIDGTPQIAAFEFACPDYIRNTRFVSENGQVWYKITLNSGNVMLYPDEYDGDSMWCVGKWDKLDISVNCNHSITQVRKINGEEVPYFFDIDRAVMFEEDDFELAFMHFNKLMNEQYND